MSCALYARTPRSTSAAISGRDGGAGVAEGDGVDWSVTSSTTAIGDTRASFLRQGVAPPCSTDPTMRNRRRPSIAARSAIAPQPVDHPVAAPRLERLDLPDLDEVARLEVRGVALEERCVHVPAHDVLDASAAREVDHAALLQRLKARGVDDAVEVHDHEVVREVAEGAALGSAHDRAPGKALAGPEAERAVAEVRAGLGAEEVEHLAVREVQDEH